VIHAIHPGIDVETVVGKTGWDLVVADDLRITEAPTVPELSLLRDLKERTALAHSGM